MDTLVSSNISKAVMRTGAVIDHAQELLGFEIFHLDSSYRFAPVAIESCGAFGTETHPFFRELGYCI